jgi:hypothetical protein
VLFAPTGRLAVATGKVASGDRGPWTPPPRFRPAPTGRLNQTYSTNPPFLPLSDVSSCMALRPRTLALRAALSAAAGFLSTIAIAWASAYFYPCPFNASSVPACTTGFAALNQMGEVERYDTHLASFVSASCMFLIADGDWPGGRPPIPSPDFHWRTYTPPWALEDVSLLLHSRLAYAEVSFEAHGWPAKSWCFSSRRFASPRLELAHALRVPHWRNTSITAFRGYGAVLPYGPIWPGIALNASLVAVPLFLLTTLAPALRATLRRRRARCPKCNYDLRGLTASTPCPECGAML